MALMAGLAALLTGCSASARSVPPPNGVVADLGAASGVAEADALRKLVARYVAGRFMVGEARFFRNNSYTNWSQVSLHVANARKAVAKGTTGGPTRLQRPVGAAGFDLIDVYPADRKGGAFAVAMAEAPFPDGTRLVGYFTLEPGR